jgi:hypothetical protein
MRKRFFADERAEAPGDFDLDAVRRRRAANEKGRLAAAPPRLELSCADSEQPSDH